MSILKWALIFFLISVVAGVFGFTGISAASADIARVLFYIFGVIFLILTFQSSANLAEAYGVAVTGTMLVNTLMAFTVVRHKWKWSWWAILLTLAGKGLGVMAPLVLGAAVNRLAAGQGAATAVGLGFAAFAIGWALARAAYGVALEPEPRLIGAAWPLE